MQINDKLTHKLFGEGVIVEITRRDEKKLSPIIKVKFNHDNKEYRFFTEESIQPHLANNFNCIVTSNGIETELNGEEAIEYFDSCVKTFIATTANEYGMDANDYEISAVTSEFTDLLNQSVEDADGKWKVSIRRKEGDE